MSYTFKGKIVSAEAPRTGNGQKGAWASRRFVVEEDADKYPQKAQFTMFKNGEHTAYATDKFPAVGSDVEVEFNLRLVEGNSKTGKPYAIQELSVWKINVLGGNNNGSHSTSSYEEDDSDLPFG